MTSSLKSRCNQALSSIYLSKIDPERLKNFFALIVQFLPMIIALFSPAPPVPADNKVQAVGSITTLEGLIDYVQIQIELRSLTEDQQTKVVNAVEALAQFLIM